MSGVFERAGIAHPNTVPVRDRERLRALTVNPGFPLVLEPDFGSGAVDTFSAEGERALDAALERDLPGHVAQPFITGQIVTFDGLTDGNGRIIFHTSHAYDTGITLVPTARTPRSRRTCARRAASLRK